MSRLIDADALIPNLKFIREAEHQIYGKGSWEFANKCITAVEDAPTIEKRKNGKWIVCDGDWFKTMCKCSECGAMIDFNEKDINVFCYHCGARMDGKEDKKISCEERRNEAW